MEKPSLYNWNIAFESSPPREAKYSKLPSWPVSKESVCSQNRTFQILKLLLIARLHMLLHWREGYTTALSAKSRNKGWHLFYENDHQILCQHRSTCSRYRSVCFMAGVEVQSSTCSPLLGELQCLTGAREAQGSIIDLTSQSCRAPSPSFTPPDCQPHTNSTTCTHTHLHTHSLTGVCEHTGMFNAGGAPLCQRFLLYMELHTDCPCVTSPLTGATLAALKS